MIVRKILESENMIAKKNKQTNDLGQINIKREVIFYFCEVMMR